MVRLSFSIEHCLSGGAASVVGARTGWLQTATQRIMTPAPIFYTRKATPPSFTPDVLVKDSSIQAVNVSMPQVMDQVENVAKQGEGLDKFVGSSRKAMFLAVRDVVEHQTGMPAGDNYISVETGRGRAKLTVDTYLRAIEVFKLDVVAGLSDEVTATSGSRRIRKSVDRTLAWLGACLDARDKKANDTAVFGVAQVLANDCEKREEVELVRSCKETGSKPVDGFAIGGLGLGETAEERRVRLQKALTFLPEKSPKWLQGLGDPDYVFEGVANGLDLFDTAYPFALSELGAALTFPTELAQYVGDKTPSTPYKIDLRSDEYKLDGTPISDKCECETCRRHTRAYIHHLLNTREIIGDVLLNTHNSYHYARFFAMIRESIAAGTFATFRANFENYRASSN